MVHFNIRNYAALLLIAAIFQPLNAKQAKKPWTVIVFAAADNNLRDFAPRNQKQMSLVGSNEHVNMLMHMDIRLSGSKKISRRYYIEKNNPVQIEMTEKGPMDSGDPSTLISACRWAIEEYPAEHYMLVLWNHGTGIIDPYGRRQFDTNFMFHYNADTNNFELDRTVGFIDLIEALDDRGICWDDSSGNYLTNQKLEQALNEIVTNQLDGKKFDIIAFDACLMSMLEVANITKNYATIQVSSQEVEPGPGWKYDEALSIFANKNPDKREVATNIVNAFAKAYKPSGNHPGFIDYTQSAIDLTVVDELERNVNELADILIRALDSDKAHIYKNLIATSRAKKNLTHFNEPTYVDLHHLYTNLLKNLREHFKNMDLLNMQLLRCLDTGLALFKKVVIHSVSGSNLPNARGISIFFPEKRIHPSYKKANFAKNNWINFLSKYVLNQ
ncbi:N/A [soil metagenome]